MVLWNWINYGILPILARIALSVALANMFLNSDFGGKARTFLKHADDTARSMSNPQIVFWSRSNTGEPIKVSHLAASCASPLELCLQNQLTNMNDLLLVSFTFFTFITMRRVH